MIQRCMALWETTWIQYIVSCLVAIFCQLRNDAASRKMRDMYAVKLLLWTYRKLKITTLLNCMFAHKSKTVTHLHRELLSVEVKFFTPQWIPGACNHRTLQPKAKIPPETAPVKSLGEVLWDFKQAKKSAVLSSSVFHEILRLWPAEFVHMNLPNQAIVSMLWNCMIWCFKYLKRFCAPHVMMAYGSDVPFRFTPSKFFAARSSSCNPDPINHECYILDWI
jgi:hypothetical protein